MSSSPVARTWSCVFFDLDGTIVDSAPGITDRIARTLDMLGRPVPDAATLLAFVGPPLLEGFERFAGMTDLEAREALVVYRGLVAAEGAERGAAVYPGIAGVVEAVAAAGIPVALATSKPESQANALLAAAGLTDAFTVVCGASEDEVRSAKVDVLAEARRRLHELGVDTEHSVMVGDRHHDVDGAAAFGIPTILVEWGYGSPAEAEHAMAVVHSTDQLATLLLG